MATTLIYNEETYVLVHIENSMKLAAIPGGANLPRGGVGAACRCCPEHDDDGQDENAAREGSAARNGHLPGASYTLLIHSYLRSYATYHELFGSLLERR